MLVLCTRTAHALAACHCCCLACHVPECYCDAAGGSYRSVIYYTTHNRHWCYRVCNMSQSDRYRLFIPLTCLVCMCRQYEQAIKVHAYSLRLIHGAGGPVLLLLLDSESEWAVAWEGQSPGPQGPPGVSNCSQLRSDWSQVLTNNWQYLVHGCTALSLTDHTLNVLLDHLRDLYLATILARLADWSEP